jgi:hypothetical protein
VGPAFPPLGNGNGQAHWGNFRANPINDFFQ